MNEITLVFTEKNILDNLLYTASKSDQLKKSRKTGRLLFAVFIVLFSLILLAINKLIAGLTFVVGIIIFLLFPQYLKLYYKKYLIKTSKSGENKKLVNLEYKITLKDDCIESKNTMGESKYLHNGFEYISETEENIFIKLNTPMFLVFPKNQIDNIEELKNYFEAICNKHNIEYIDEKNWVWK